MEHVHEFRRRLLWCALFFVIGGFIGYSLYDYLFVIVQQPLNQTLYFTSPTGGFNFVFKVCAAFGLITALPMIVFQLFKFLEPVTKRTYRLMVLTYLVWSANLAYIGVLFGYFISLPAALHFLTQFGGENIQALITADEYFNFALAYIVGFALLFQLPLIITFMNRIKPMKPGGMMKAQRWVILTSFIVAAILTPTPDPLNQLIMAIPVIVLYQISVVMVWLINRKRHTVQPPRISIANSKITDSGPREVTPSVLSGQPRDNFAQNQITEPTQNHAVTPSALGATRRGNINGLLNNATLVKTQEPKELKQPVQVTFDEDKTDVIQVRPGNLIDVMVSN